MGLVRAAATVPPAALHRADSRGEQGAPLTSDTCTFRASQKGELDEGEGHLPGEGGGAASVKPPRAAGRPGGPGHGQAGGAGAGLPRG